MGERVLRYRETLTVSEPFVPSGVGRTVGVSAGTAAVLGLRRIRQVEAPTTAYLMVGERCCHDCTFCAQAQRSAARSHFLSRIAWPPYPLEQVVHAVAHGFAQREIVRCCLQVTVSRGYLSQTLSLAQQLHSLSSIPICASIAVPDLDSIRALLESGVERVTLALDSACERVYCEAKGRGWQRQLDLLRTAARLFPGRIGTHLIAGLGETEQELSVVLQDMVDRQVAIGLFSFTPVPGTAWGNRPPPLLSSYRRIQACRYLLTTGARRVQDFSFSLEGQIVSYGLSREQLYNLLADGRSFQTAGCPGCNRPYYNERPGRVMYNYPRPLSAEEIEAAMSATVADLAFAQAPGRAVCSLPNGV
jgi:biotin synthase-related radical SAM superfamily protein